MEDTRGRSRFPWMPTWAPGASRAPSSVVEDGPPSLDAESGLARVAAVLRGAHRLHQVAGHSVARAVPARQLRAAPRILSGTGGPQRSDHIRGARRSFRA